MLAVMRGMRNYLRELTDPLHPRNVRRWWICFSVILLLLIFAAAMYFYDRYELMQTQMQMMQTQTREEALAIGYQLCLDNLSMSPPVTKR